MADVTDEEYPMTSTPRGFCLIISNAEFEDPTKNRAGCAEDTAALQDVFTFLGFTVDIQENQTAQQMQNLILDYSKKETYGDCFVCCVLSHGHKQGVLGTDMKIFTLNNIFSPFDGKFCPTLVGKPKVFFINACRGLKKEEPVWLKGGETSYTISDDEEESYTITKDSDFLVAMSTVENYVSYRSRSGSWFIQSLCKHLQYGSQMGEDILTILTKVCDDVSRKEGIRVNNTEVVGKMTPESRFTLRKKLIFRIP